MHIARRNRPATTAHRPHCMPVALPLLDRDPPLVRRRVRVPREPPSRVWDASFLPCSHFLLSPAPSPNGLLSVFQPRSTPVREPTRKLLRLYRTVSPRSLVTSIPAPQCLSSSRSPARCALEFPHGRLLSSSRTRFKPTSRLPAIPRCRISPARPKHRREQVQRSLSLSLPLCLSPSFSLPKRGGGGGGAPAGVSLGELSIAVKSRPIASNDVAGTPCRARNEGENETSAYSRSFGRHDDAPLPTPPADNALLSILKAVYDWGASSRDVRTRMYGIEKV